MRRIALISKIRTKWGGLSVQSRAALVFSICSLFLKGIAFITTPIYTRLMSTTEYGIVAEYSSWYSILEVFALLGFTSAGAFNSGLNEYRGRRSEYISTVLLLCNGITIGFFVLVFLLKIFLGDTFILPGNQLIPMMINFIFYPAQIFWITWQRYEYKYKMPAIITLVSTVVVQLITVLSILYIQSYEPSIVKIWCSAIAPLLFSVPIYILLLKKEFSFDASICKSLILFALPLVPHYLAQHIMSSADRIMISRLSSQADAAIYSIAANVSLISTVVWNAINASLIPYLYENLNTKSYSNIRRISTPILIGYAAICFLVSLIAPEAIMILGPEEYQAGVYAIPPIAITAFLTAFYNFYANIEFYHKKSKNIATATIIACGVDVVLNYLLIPLIGFVGAAYTTLIANVVLIALHYYGYRKCQNEKVYDDKIFILIAIGCVTLCEVCNLLYLNNVVRYLFILLLVVICVIKRTNLIEIYQRIKGKNDNDR